MRLADGRALIVYVADVREPGAWTAAPRCYEDVVMIASLGRGLYVTSDGDRTYLAPHAVIEIEPVNDVQRAGRHSASPASFTGRPLPYDMTGDILRE